MVRSPFRRRAHVGPALTGGLGLATLLAGPLRAQGPVPAPILLPPLEAGAGAATTGASRLPSHGSGSGAGRPVPHPPRSAPPTSASPASASPVSDTPAAGEAAVGTTRLDPASAGGRGAEAETASLDSLWALRTQRQGARLAAAALAGALPPGCVLGSTRGDRPLTVAEGRLDTLRIGPQRAGGRGGCPTLLMVSGGVNAASVSDARVAVLLDPSAAGPSAGGATGLLLLPPAQAGRAGVLTLRLPLATPRRDPRTGHRDVTEALVSLVVLVDPRLEQPGVARTIPVALGAEAAAPRDAFWRRIP